MMLSLVPELREGWAQPKCNRNAPGQAGAQNEGRSGRDASEGALCTSHGDAPGFPAAHGREGHLA